MTIQFDENLMAAAALADRYIEIVLSKNPELLVGSIFRKKLGDAGTAASEMADFRLQLINQLSQQPLPSFEED